MFELKTIAEVAKMSVEEQQVYMTAKATHEATERKAEIEKAIAEAGKNNATKEEIEALTKANNDIVKELERIGLEAKKGGESTRNETKSFKEVVYEFIASNAEAIQKAFKSNGLVEMDVTKAVGVVETGSASLPVTAPSIHGVQVAPPNRANLRSAIINQMVTTIPTTQAAYAYTETLPKEGGFEFVAEKGIKPQIDMKFETRYATPVKVAAWMKLTEEAIQDIPNLQAIAYDFLRKQHDLKREKGIILGDGTSPNPKGATVYGRAFSAGSLALSVVEPNFMDVVNACITDIYTTHNFTDEMPYMANIVLVNPNDYFIQLVSAKDKQGLPLYPSASLFNQVTIGGVTIMPHEDIVAGKIFVADLSKYNTTNYIGYNVKVGYVNDDLIKNQFCIVGESRFHAFVKKLDEQAFIYDTIATIKTAITKAP
jgi:HK97 family phage major capsid protein